MAHASMWMEEDIGDEYADIAVIKIDEKYVTSVATLGSSEKSKLGDTVFAVGTPMSTEYRGTVTRGIISGKDRMVTVSSEGSSDWIMNVMQTDAAINPGNSGGPIIDALNKNIIGIYWGGIKKGDDVINCFTPIDIIWNLIDYKE